MTNCPAVGCDLVVLNSFNVFFVFFLGRLWLRSRRRCRPLIGRSVARSSCTSKCPWTTYWTLHCSTAPLSKLLWKWHPPRTYWVTQSLLKGLAGKFKENGGCSSSMCLNREVWSSKEEQHYEEVVGDIEKSDVEQLLVGITLICLLVSLKSPGSIGRGPSPGMFNRKWVAWVMSMISLAQVGPYQFLFGWLGIEWAMEALG